MTRETYKYPTRTSFSHYIPKMRGKCQVNHAGLGLHGYVSNYSASLDMSRSLMAEILRASGVEVANYE